MQNDLQHLRLLSLFHYIFGGLLALAACFPGIYLIMGILMVTGGFGPPGPGAPPPAVGWFLIIFSTVAILIGWALALCLLISGYKLSVHKSYLFSMVIAGITCAIQPLGTILGVFTIIVLLRPKVRELYGRESPRDRLEYDRDDRDDRDDRLDLRDREDRSGRRDRSDPEDESRFMLPESPEGRSP